MNIHELAEYSVNHLAPALPFLLDAGHGAAKKAGELSLGGITEVAQRIWSALRPKAEGSQSMLLDAAKDVAIDPTDQDARGALRLQVRKLLESDSSLQTELSNILGSVAIQQNTATASGTGAIAVGGNVAGSSLTTNAQP